MIQTLEEKNLENGDLISKLEQNNDDSFLLIEHEIKQNIASFNAVLNILENLFKEQLSFENNEAIEIYSKTFSRAHRVINSSLESLVVFNYLSKPKNRKT